VLMLLDRRADVHLARRSAADGWLVKPLDALRLRRAADAIVAGGRYTEGVPADAAPVDSMIPLPDVAVDADGEADGAENEPVSAG